MSTEVSARAVEFWTSAEASTTGRTRGRSVRSRARCTLAARLPAEGGERPVHPASRTSCRPTGSSSGRSPGCSSTSASSSWPWTQDIPLLERAKFLAIFSSNLDEFFMIRVAGLKRRIATGIAVRSAAGLEPREVLEKISEVAGQLQRMQADVFLGEVRPALEEEGITIVRWADLTDAEREPLHGPLHRPHLPGADPAVRRPGAPVPLHLRALAEPRGDPRQPQDRQRALRADQGAAVAATARPRRRRPS